MLKEHATKQYIRKEVQEKRKSEAVVSAQMFCNSLVDHLNARVSRAYQNQKRLDIECKKLEKNALSISSVAEQWISLIDAFNYSLKEIGDVKTWSNAIKKDTKIIAQTLEKSHKAKVGRLEQRPDDNELN